MLKSHGYFTICWKVRFILDNQSFNIINDQLCWNTITEDWSVTHGIGPSFMDVIFIISGTKDMEKLVEFFTKISVIITVSDHKFLHVFISGNVCKFKA